MQFKVSLQIPFIGGVEGSWEPSDVEREAAWELYVELVTRISVVELDPEDGKLRESMTSLYQLFAITRDILKRYGPNVAKAGNSKISFGALAVLMLNGAVRPVLAHWHPRLMAYEELRPSNLDSTTHEKQWEYAGELRRELESTRIVLTEIATLMGNVARVTSLLPHDLPQHHPPNQRERSSENNSGPADQ